MIGFIHIYIYTHKDIYIDIHIYIYTVRKPTRVHFFNPDSLSWLPLIQ